ncbi:M10 family metallopeptidase C-terminal domain-containing protein [Seohaeicola saemankumensis]|nr:M10 family metallopeptidase [Seohaeicola saemankumensis]MCA0872151.1 M10 family metallopeptidase C-terminal domain-containing protein [Seohaeicola saemankumensis]
MTGTGHTLSFITSSGDDRIDGVLAYRSWADPTVRFSFPTSDSVYGNEYGGGEDAGFFALTATMQTAARRALEVNFGNAANDGFAIEGFTGLRLAETTSANAHLRLAQTNLNPYGAGTAWAYLPSTEPSGGDVWFSTVRYDYTAPRAGNYAHLTMLHEIGHALGLDHAHSAGAFGAVPAAYDAMEYTLMTYRSYVGGALSGYTNETWGYAQSFMMLDIAALQYLYGADFTTNAGDTVYSWTPGSGITGVDGRNAINPGANRIFATVWDGGGIDTYDLSAYATDLAIDLAPGAASLFDAAQLARLASGIYASGNIYNALLYQDDLQSLIENALGGTGDDRISGNVADNALNGGPGDDRLTGRQGDDRLTGGSGDDTLIGGSGDDRLTGGRGNDALRGQTGDDDLRGHAGDDVLLGARGQDRLLGGAGNDLMWGGGDDDVLIGQGGNDEMYGDAGDDLLIGGLGQDRMMGGDGADVFRFHGIDDSPLSASDEIIDFVSGQDRIDLSPLAAAPFSFAIGGGFTGTGPHVSVRASGTDLRVLVDADGDGTADLRIILSGVTTVTESDFLL